MCQLVFIGKEGALCVQDILERSKSLFIEVERKLQCLHPLIDDFPERDNLFDRVLVGIHGIVHFLDSCQYILIELSDRLVELGFCQPCRLRQLCSLEEIPGDAASGGDHAFVGAEAQNVTFAYEDETILDQYSLKLEPGKITGIHGASGSGKSTILKLLMRFWDVQTGRVSVDGADVREIPTKHLRDMESYVTQETHLFHDSIANNIAIAKPGATREEIMEAAKKASIHDFIMTLPNGYDTEVGELGDTLSGGEKQRIGIARAFLHDASMILLDEPTSNLDSLNEGIILKSLKESAEEKTIVLVSHRVSTMNVANVVYEMENGRIS